MLPARGNTNNNDNNDNDNNNNDNNDSNDNDDDNDDHNNVRLEGGAASGNRAAASRGSPQVHGH